MNKPGILYIVVLLLVLAVSCVSKEVPVTETYYETEYRTDNKTETYTETENVVIKTIDGKQEIYYTSGWFSDVMTFTGGEGSKTSYYRYVIDAGHTRSQVKIMVYPATYGYVGVYDFTGVGEINAPPTPTDLEPGAIYYKRQDWIDNLNSILSSQLLGSYTSGISNEISFDANRIKEFAIFTNTKPDNVISSVELLWADDTIEKRPVTKERLVPYQVPVQVEKQRTVMQTKKVPFWEAIFH